MLTQSVADFTCSEKCSVGKATLKAMNHSTFLDIILKESYPMKRNLVGCFVN